MNLPWEPGSGDSRKEVETVHGPEAHRKDPQEAVRPGCSAHTLGSTTQLFHSTTPPTGLCSFKTSQRDRLYVSHSQALGGHGVYQSGDGSFAGSLWKHLPREKPEVRWCVWKMKIEADLAWKPFNTPGNVCRVYTGAFPA